MGDARGSVAWTKIRSSKQETTDPKDNKPSIIPEPEGIVGEPLIDQADDPDPQESESYEQSEDESFDREVDPLKNFVKIDQTNLFERRIFLKDSTAENDRGNDGLVLEDLETETDSRNRQEIESGKRGEVKAQDAKPKTEDSSEDRKFSKLSKSKFNLIDINDEYNYIILDKKTKTSLYLVNVSKTSKTTGQRSVDISKDLYPLLDAYKKAVDNFKK